MTINRRRPHVGKGTSADATAAPTRTSAARNVTGRVRNSHIRFWRSEIRPKVVRSAADGTKGLRWSRPLFEALIEELHVDDSLEDLIGQRVTTLTRAQYPQAVALALILRHSWRDDDLADIVERVRPSGRRKV